MHRLRPTIISSSRQFIRTPCRHYSNDPGRVINLTDIPAPHNGRIRILSLNRPSARNAISTGLLNELRDHVDSISSEYGPDGSEISPEAIYSGVDEKASTRALVIASEVDTCFCAGADLKERAGFSLEEYYSSTISYCCPSRSLTNIWPLKNQYLPL
jgi:methylglutaconyl-CoA hydratase